MKSFILSGAAAVLLLFTTIQTFAQLEGNPENLCRSGFFPRESAAYRLASVKGAKNEKVYFYGDERSACPDGKNCRMKSYLIPNDEVVVSRTFGRWACSWYQPKKGSETVGWIAVDKLDFRETNQNPALADWLGAWNYAGENRIEIGKSKTNGSLAITGNAVWRGLGDNIHTGEIDDESKPAGNELKIGADAESEDECQVTMRLVGKYLVVSDNLRCGGVNVSFSGVYRKK
ncbi:MAG TPA: hypothetical protein VK400_01685 [Pyrinomonadaceae bacterium]|nr:hypothetical protein [Pyrinomonadaceae bacterium]